MDTTTILSVISKELFQNQYFWALIIGFVLAFFLGFGMGANDVSNAFGTSVGSKVLTLKMAYILATIVESLGAIFVGYNVTDTIRKGVVDISMYNGSENALLLGQLAVLGGGSTWLGLATLLKAPVSTTHSIMGATLGFSLVMKGFNGIQWIKVIEIAISWVLSPLLSGITSICLYMIVDFSVLRRRDPLKCGLRALPIFYFFCITFNTFAVTYQGSKLIGLSNVPFWLSLTISFLFGIITLLVIQFIVRPRLVSWIEEEDPVDTKLATMATISPNGARNLSIHSISFPSENNNINMTTVNGFKPQIAELEYSAGQKHSRHQPFNLSPKGLVKWFFPHKNRQEDIKTLKLFSSIQVFTACFAGFAHGANDVSNAIGPLTALRSIYVSNSVFQTEATPILILVYGVVSICIGLWLLGHRVMKTVGQNMAEINPCSGFCIEFGAAVTVLVASKLGLPISTTHCLIGSVVGVSTVKSGEGIDWKIFGGIALSWVITLPVSALISACIMLILNKSFL